VWRMKGVEDEGCGGRRVWRMKGVEDVKGVDSVDSVIMWIMY
jgi:hypothetical protein